MGFFVTLILTAAFLLLSTILKPKTENENARPASLGDFNFPTAVEGRPVPIVWGTVKLNAPNVVWYGDLESRAIKEKVKTGLFSSKDVTVGFRYFVGIQFGLCRGPIDEINRIWIGDDEVFNGSSVPVDAGTDIVIDEPRLFGGNKDRGGVQGTLRFFPGTETQGASSYLSQFQQEGGDTPGYRGTCFAAPATDPIYVGNSTSIKPWRFEVRRIPTQLSTTNAVVNGVDANPAHVLFEMMTDGEWGLGLPPSDVDTANFEAAAATLASEGNGFSFILDNQRDLLDLVREIERQIDGVVFNDRTDGLWKIKLTRADFVVGNLPLIDPDNGLLEIEDFRRAAWQDTQNHVRIRFSDRARDYFETYASAQDMANVEIQKANVQADQAYPGVKDRTLANQIAWRELRSLSRPLAKATVAVDRRFFGLVPGEAVRWTDPDLGFTDLVMRVSSIGLGELASGRIKLQLVEDVFSTDVPAFSDPGTSNWVPPVDTLVGIPAGDHQAFEAPKAFVDRDPELPGQAPRIWVGARSQGDGAVDADILEAGTDAGSIAGFLLAGELNASITKDQSQGSGSISINPTPDSKQEILDAFGNGFPAIDIGQQLSGLLLVGTEFMAFQTVLDGGSTIDLSNGYRGLLDSVPQDHSAGTRVWLLFVNGNLLARVIPTGSRTVELLTESLTDTLSVADATDVSVQVDGDRHLLPYPPVTMNVNGVDWESSADLDNGGPTFDELGLDIDWIRRDFRTDDEVASVANENSLPSDFPAANTTEYRVEVFDDPDGSLTSLFTTDWQTGDGVAQLVSRTKILRFLDGVVPSRLRLSVQTRHTVDSVVREATQQLEHDLNVSSTLSSLDNLGTLSGAEVSPIYTAPTTGTYTLNISVNLDAGDIQARINGGAWQNVITSGNNTGTLAGVTAGDDLEFRTNGASITDRGETFLEIDAPSSSSDAYAILIL